MDKSGRRRAVAGRHTIGIRAIRALRSIAAEKEPRHFPLDFRKRRIQRFASRIDDYGPLGAQPIEIKADGLADPPLDAVAHHGLADGARDSEANAGAVRLRFTNAESGE